MSITLSEPRTREAAPVLSRAVVALDAKASKAFAPPPKISTPDWITRNVYLPADVSDTPGPMALFSYQVEIAAACDDPEIDRIVWMKGARQGATSLAVAVTASFVVNNPKNIMWVQPTQDDARDFVVSTIEPVFAASPSLAGLLVQDEKKRDTIQSRRFPSGSAKFVGAAARNFRRHFVHVLFLDEVDGYPDSPEGDIVTLAINRTRTARDRLIFMASTPTDAETSRIAREYEASDKRIYEVRCDECAEFFELLWKHIKWEKTEDGEHLPDTAHAVCPHCDHRIEESRKAAVVEAGRWRKTAPHIKGVAGFKSSALISSIEHARWPQIVREFLEAKKDRELLKVWTNTLCGDVFHDTAGEGLDEDSLASRAEPCGLEAIPADVLLLTAGADVQDDRLEVVTLGHTAGGAMIVLDYETIHGPPTADQTWQDLDDLLKRRFPSKLGGSLGYDAAGVDSGSGSHSDIVYRYTRARFSKRIVATKGDGGSRPLIERSSKQGLYIIGADTAKSRIYGLLERPGVVRFSDDLPMRFYEELCGERRVTFYKSGQLRKRWERIPGVRNEALDATCIAMAVRQLVSTDLVRRENELRQVITPAKMPTVIHSKWMQRGGR